MCFIHDTPWHRTSPSRTKVSRRDKTTTTSQFGDKSVVFKGWFGGQTGFETQDLSLAEHEMPGLMSCSTEFDPSEPF